CSWCPSGSGMIERTGGAQARGLLAGGTGGEDVHVVQRHVDCDLVPFGGGTFTHGDDDHPGVTDVNAHLDTATESLGERNAAGECEPLRAAVVGPARPGQLE